MKIKHGIPILGRNPDKGAIEQMETCLKSDEAVAGALMADHHLGYSQPVGGVVAYENAVSPSGVGYDIGCGNLAVRLDFPPEELRSNISTIMDDIVSSISFGIGRGNKEVPKLPSCDVLWNHPYWDNPVPTELRQLAENQLGTVGGGNHYVDLFTDEKDRVWVGVHFGSRGFGHKSATHFLRLAGHSDAMMAEPTVFGLGTDLGCEYWESMVLAGLYAEVGREYVCWKVNEILGSKILERVSNHHNYAWEEEHQGREVVVVRKGATPNFPGQKSFVGGSMGQNSFILEGVEIEKVSDKLFDSTIHGAGRAMGRIAAAGKFKRGAKLSRIVEGGDLEHLQPKLDKRQQNQLHNFIEAGCPEDLDKKIHVKIKEGAITPEMMEEWVDRAGVELRGSNVEESPHCYKDIELVLEDQGSTVKLIHTLTPVGVAMADKNVKDPYKD